MKSAVGALVASLGLANVAMAQQGFNYADPRALGQTFPTSLQGTRVDPNTAFLQARGFAGRGDDGSVSYSFEFLRLSDVLRAAAAGSGGITQDQLNAALGAQGAQINAAIAAQGAQLSSTLTGIANRLDRLTDRFREGIALAGSINVLPPNPGDRFAVSFGGAGYDGTGAGSVAVSARLKEDIIAYGAVARGPTQTLVKGGVGFSFR